MALTVATLPTNVDSTDSRTRVTIENDDTAGVGVGPRIGAVVDDPGGTPLTIELCADRGTSFADGKVQGGMWLIEGRSAIDPSKTYAITPDLATKYQAYDPETLAGGEVAHIYEWRGIEVPDGHRSTLWVQVCVIVPAASQPGGDGVQFAGWAGRERGDDFRIEFFTYPAVYMESYAGGSGNARQNAYQQRTVVPFTFTAIRTGWHSNVSVGLASQPTSLGGQFFGIDETNISNVQVGLNNAFHPMPGWTMSYAATAAVNPDDAGTYLRTCMLLGRDKNPNGPWWKNIRWGCPITSAATDTHYLVWRAAHIPRLATDWARPTLSSTTGGGTVVTRRPHLDFRNSCGPQWIPEIQTFLAPDPAWWMTAAQRYRDYFEDYWSPTPVRSNTNLGTVSKEGSILIASVHFSPSSDTRSNQTFLKNALDEYKLLASWMSGGSRGLVGLCHFQAEWRSDDLGFPPGSLRLDTLPEAAEELTAAGWQVSTYHVWTAYLQGQGVVEGVTPRFSVVRQLVSGERESRGGEPSRVGEESFIIAEHPDYGDQVAKFLVQSAREVGLRATYIDTLAGDFEPYIQPGVHEAWGNPWITFYKRDIISKARTRLQAENFPNHWVMSEAATEGLEDIDWRGNAAPLLPYHQVNWEANFYEAYFDGSAPAELTAAPFEARNPDPPLWQAAHNLWNPQGGWNAITSFANTADSDLTISGGYSDAEWLRWVCFPYAANYIKGIAQIIWEASTSYSDFPILNTTGASTRAVGTTAMTFIRTLYDSFTATYAKQFLIDGHMQHPLTVDFSDTTNNAQVDNPLKPYATNVVGWRGFQDLNVGLSGSPVQFSYFSYPPPANPVTGIGVFESISFDVAQIAVGDVPQVLHGVWKSDIDDKVGIVLVNWTNTTGRFQATVRPSLYGLSGTVNVNVLSTGGVETSQGSSAAATFTISDNAGTGGIKFGTIPAHSVVILTLT